MEKHHQEVIDRLVALFEPDPQVQALVLGGSIAHGFATPGSDVDVTFVVDSSDYEQRRQNNKLCYYNPDLCAYEGGYVDGKYTHLGLLKLVAERGSDPARYAYKDCRILFSRDSEIERVLAAIVRYPSEKTPERLERFAAQILAWRWYFGEATKKQNQYLAMLAIQKIVLFSGRIVLAANAMLYPYHKWLLAELGNAAHKPEHLLAEIDELLATPNLDNVNAYCAKILAFAGCDEATLAWPNRFVLDSELNWVDREAPIDDI